MQRDQNDVDNAAQKDKDEYDKTMEEIAKEVTVADKLSEGPGKKRQMADIALRQGNAKSYYEEKIARKNTPILRRCQ